MTRFFLAFVFLVASCSVAPDRQQIDPHPILVEKPTASAHSWVTARGHPDKPAMREPTEDDIRDGLARLQGQLEWAQQRLPKGNE